MKIRLAQARVIQTMHPFVAIRTKKRKKRNNQTEKQTSHPKEKVEEQNDLD
jgi:hypothetical protein